MIIIRLRKVIFRKRIEILHKNLKKRVPNGLLLKKYSINLYDFLKAVEGYDVN